MIGIEDAIARVRAALAARPFRTTLALRLLPVGSNLALNLLAGLGRIPVLPFLAASAIGYLPQTLIFVLLGEGVAVDRHWQLGLGAGRGGHAGPDRRQPCRRRGRGHGAAQQAVQPAPHGRVGAARTGVSMRAC